MKNIHIYIIGLFLGLTMFSCNSLEETYKELDASVQDVTGIQEIDLTLGEDEFEELEDVNGAENIFRFQQFSDEEEAKTYIPYILKGVYPHLGKGSSVNVSYEIYNPKVINTAYTFELTPEDYAALGHDDGLLSSESDIIEAVDYKGSDFENYDLVTLHFLYDLGDAVDTAIGKIARYNDAWYYADAPTVEDYNAMGQSFPNFSSRTTARRNLSIWLGEKYPYAYEEDIKAVVFTYTYVPSGGSRVFEDFLVIFEYDGEKWVPKEDVEQANLKFSYDGLDWIPDNTIRYTLASADFTLIGDNEGGSAGTSAANYGNFDRRPSASAYWSDEMILNGLNYFLKTTYPNAAVGQKYLITYAIYNGTSGTETIYVIKDASGEYVIFEG